MKVLFLSGYSANAIHETFVLLPGDSFPPETVWAGRIGKEGPGSSGQEVSPEAVIFSDRLLSLTHEIRSTRRRIFLYIRSHSVDLS